MNPKPSLCKGRGTTKWWKGCLLKSRKKQPLNFASFSSSPAGSGTSGVTTPQSASQPAVLACGLGHLGVTTPQSAPQLALV